MDITRFLCLALQIDNCLTEEHRWNQKKNADTIFFEEERLDVLSLVLFEVKKKK